MGTKIEWTDESWNPVVGCTKASEGCQNCYAERMAWRLASMGKAGYDEVVLEGGGWNGKVVTLVDQLNKPLHWRKPRMIFVCSMSDLFHPQVPFEFIDKVMAVIALCPRHTFQVLTKRPERMVEYLNSRKPDIYGGNVAVEEKYLCKIGLKGHPVVFLLHNLWLGVTVENQEWWNKRKDAFLSIPGAVLFVSNEPCLGNIKYSYAELQKIGWMIVGAESGPKKRHCELEWVRNMKYQCYHANIPVFVKQLNINGKISHDMSEWPESLRVREMPKESR